MHINFQVNYREEQKHLKRKEQEDEIEIKNSEVEGGETVMRKTSCSGNVKVQLCAMWQKIALFFLNDISVSHRGIKRGTVSRGQYSYFGHCCCGSVAMHRPPRPGCREGARAGGRPVLAHCERLTVTPPRLPCPVCQTL